MQVRLFKHLNNFLSFLLRRTNINNRSSNPFSLAYTLLHLQKYTKLKLAYLLGIIQVNMVTIHISLGDTTLFVQIPKINSAPISNQLTIKKSMLNIYTRIYTSILVFTYLIHIITNLSRK